MRMRGPRSRLWLALVALGACSDTRSARDAAASVDEAGLDGSVSTDAADDSGVEADAAQDADSVRMLVHNALWSEVSGDADPFGSLSGACAPDSFGEENLGGELVFYVRTQSCSPLTVTQSSRVDVEEGDQLSVRAYHFPLTAPEGATATLVLRLGETEVFRDEIPIPSDQEELTSTWVADQSYPKGTPVWFHVENHGSNEYALISVAVE